MKPSISCSIIGILNILAFLVCDLFGCSRPFAIRLGSMKPTRVSLLPAFHIIISQSDHMASCKLMIIYIWIWSLSLGYRASPAQYCIFLRNLDRLNWVHQKIQRKCTRTGPLWKDDNYLPGPE